MLKDIRLVGYGRDICPPDKARVYTIPDFYMIHFIERGSGYFNGIRLSAGQGFVCKKDRICHYFPDGDDPWTYSWVNLRGADADLIFDSLPLKADTFAWDNVKFGHLFKKIWDEHTNSLSRELAVLSTLYGIFAENMSLKPPRQRNYVEEAKSIFKNRLAEGISVADVAGELNITRAYLRNIFYEKTRRSPQQYLMELRLSRAAELMGGDYSITEIAAAVGYSDPLQFTKMFSKHFGISPTAYRKGLIEK